MNKRKIKGIVLKITLLISSVVGLLSYSIYNANAYTQKNINIEHNQIDNKSTSTTTEKKAPLVTSFNDKHIKNQKYIQNYDYLTYTNDLQRYYENILATNLLGQYTGSEGPTSDVLCGPPITDPNYTIKLCGGLTNINTTDGIVGFIDEVPTTIGNSDICALLNKNMNSDLLHALWASEIFIGMNYYIGVATDPNGYNTYFPICYQ